MRSSRPCAGMCRLRPRWGPGRCGEDNVTEFLVEKKYRSGDLIPEKSKQKVQSSSVWVGSCLRTRVNLLTGGESLRIYTSAREQNQALSRFPALSQVPPTFAPFRASPSEERGLGGSRVSCLCSLIASSSLASGKLSHLPGGMGWEQGPGSAQLSQGEACSLLSNTTREGTSLCPEPGASIASSLCARGPVQRAGLAVSPNS